MSPCKFHLLLLAVYFIIQNGCCEQNYVNKKIKNKILEDFASFKRNRNGFDSKIVLQVIKNVQKKSEIREGVNFDEGSTNIEQNDEIKFENKQGFKNVHTESEITNHENTYFGGTSEQKSELSFKNMFLNNPLNNLNIERFSNKNTVINARQSENKKFNRKNDNKNVTLSYNESENKQIVITNNQFLVKESSEPKVEQNLQEDNIKNHVSVKYKNLNKINFIDDKKITNNRNTKYLLQNALKDPKFKPKWKSSNNFFIQNSDVIHNSDFSHPEETKLELLKNIAEDKTQQHKFTNKKFKSQNENSEVTDFTKVTFPSLNDYEKLNFNTIEIQNDLRKDNEQIQEITNNNIKQINTTSSNNHNKTNDDINSKTKASQLTRLPHKLKNKTDETFVKNMNEGNKTSDSDSAMITNYANTSKNYLRRKIVVDRREHMTRRKRYVVCGSPEQYRLRQIPNCVGWTYYRPYPVSANCEPIPHLPTHTYRGPSKTWYGPKYGECCLLF